MYMPGPFLYSASISVVVVVVVVVVFGKMEVESTNLVYITA